MKLGRLVVVTVFVGAFLSEVASAIENPAGLATVPPSQLGGGLVVTPNPIDRSGNLVITGNVGGGRQFQGAVPYRSTSYFWGGLGSASLDSFLRRSYVPPGGELYTQTYQPYYSPSRTVTTLRPDRLEADQFSTYNAETRFNRGGDFSSVPLRQAGTSQDSSLSADLGSVSGLGVVGSVVPGTQGLSLPGVGTRSELGESTDVALERFGLSRLSRRVVPEGLSIEGLRRSPFSTEEFRAELEFAQLREELGQVPPEVVLRRELAGAEQMPGVGEEGRNAAESGEMWGRRRKDGLVELPGREGTTEDGVLPGGSIFLGDGRAELPEPTSRTGWQERSGLEAEVGEATERARRGEGPETAIMDFGKGIDLTSQPYGGADPLKGVRQRGTVGVGKQYGDQAREILGPYHTVASYSEARFEEHIREGDGYLGQGEYYRAAESYALALIYERGDAMAQAGRGHALFGAGEYISSALFISRALEAFAVGDVKSGAEGQQQKGATAAVLALRRNFSAMDRDDLEKRIVEAEEWRKMSDAGELHFLLAYIYYQMSRVEPAKAAIEKAYEKMPEAPAIIMLRSAIESGGNPGAEATEPAQTSGSGPP